MYSPDLREKVEVTRGSDLPDVTQLTRQLGRNPGLLSLIPKVMTPCHHAGSYFQRASVPEDIHEVCRETWSWEWLACDDTQTPHFESHHKLSFAFVSAGMEITPICFNCLWKLHYDRGHGNTLLGAMNLFKGKFIILQTHIKYSYFLQIFPLITYDLDRLSFGILSICFPPKGEVAILALLKVFILLWGFVSNGLYSGYASLVPVPLMLAV